MTVKINKALAVGFLSIFLCLLLGSCSLLNVISFNVGLTEKGKASYHMSGGIYPFGGKYLMYTGSLDARIVVLDVSDPASPTRLVNNDTELGLGGGPVAFKNLVCYGMTKDGGLMIVDFSADVKSPVVADADFISSGVLAIAVEDSTLAVLKSDGVTLYSLTDPLKPSSGEALALDGPFDANSSLLLDGSKMAVAGSTKVYLATWSAGGAPELKGSFSIDKPIPHKQCSGMAFSGGLLYYLTPGGIVPVSVSDMANPVKHDEYDLGEIFTATEGKFDSGDGDDYLAVLNGMMVISSWYGVKVFHLFNPLKPNELETDATGDTLELCSCVDGMAATEQYLYVGIYGNPGAMYIYKW